eukprot:gene3396-3721_t
MVHIVAISGSLRKASCHTGILRAIQRALPAGNTVDIIVPGDLPLFNQDIEAPEVLPAPVKDFRARVKAADAFIFAAPENNFSVSAALKNAIDWASRGPDGNLFGDKPAGIVGGGGGAGGLRAQNHLRDIAVFINLHVLNHPTVTFRIFDNPSPFDLSTGELVGQAQKEEIDRFVSAFLPWVHRINSTR